MSGKTGWCSSEPLEVGEAVAGTESLDKTDFASATGGDALRAYLVQIGRVPLLTPAEERKLCRQIEEIADRLGCTREAVRQTERRAITRLRRRRRWMRIPRVCRPAA